jgi:hypothetical protein
MQGYEVSVTYNFDAIVNAFHREALGFMCVCVGGGGVGWVGSKIRTFLPLTHLCVPQVHCYRTIHIGTGGRGGTRRHTS